MEELIAVNLEPTTRILWNYDHLNLKDLSLEIAREVYTAELTTVAEGLRKCATTHIRSEWFYEDLSVLADMGLIFIPLRKCKRIQGFANLFYDPEPNQPFDIFGIVSRSMEDAEKWKKAFYGSDHKTMGKLLGYPECCIEFFCKTFPHEYDPVWSAGINTKHILCAENNQKLLMLEEMYPECNMMLRYFGLRAIPHLPCSFTCRESIDLAEMFLGYISQKNLLLDFLESGIMWDAWKGMAIIKTPYFVGAVNTVPYKEKHIIEYKSLLGLV